MVRFGDLYGLGSQKPTIYLTNSEAKALSGKKEMYDADNLPHNRSTEGIIKFAVIADDITGACDTGAQFKKQGLKTVVSINIENIKDVMHYANVIVINTDSRNVPPNSAYEKVAAATKILKRYEITLVYKKIDSTLRGNIGQELDAVMDGLGAKIAIVAPAFPANGRITVGGYQLVNYVPLSETEFAEDLTNFLKESHIPTLLKSQSKRNVGHISLSKVLKGVKILKSEIESQMLNGNEIVVIDAITQDHLKKIAEVSAILRVTKVICGSAGLAEEVPQALNLTIKKPVVVISGSLSNVTKRQILKAKRDLNAHVIRFDPSKILNLGKAKEKEKERVIGDVIKNIDEGNDVIISTTTSKMHNIKTTIGKWEEIGNKFSDIGEIISLTLGEITEKILSYRKISGLILTGGSTATAVCRAIGAKGLMIEDEVLPGIPLSKIIGGRHDGLHVITKAGGFGDENAMVECIKYMKRRTR